MKAASKCPTCGSSREAAPKNEAFPFCSARCKLADLSNWLNERYAVPAEPVFGPDDDDSGPSKPSPLN